MGDTDTDIGRPSEPLRRSARRRSRARVVSEFEAEIRQLYAQMMDDPVPQHLLRIVRVALGSRS